MRRAPLVLGLMVAVLSSSSCSSRTSVPRSVDRSRATALQRTAEKPRRTVPPKPPQEELGPPRSAGHQGETTSPIAVGTAGSDEWASQSTETTSGTADRVLSSVPYAGYNATAETNSTGAAGHSWLESHHLPAWRRWRSFGVIGMGLACLLGLFAFLRTRRATRVGRD